MGEKNSFIFFFSWRDALSGCSPEVRLEVYDAVIEYAASGTLPQMKPVSQIAFNFIKRDIDRNNERYDEILEIRREAGRKGGRPKKENQMVFGKPNGFLEKQTKANESKKNYNVDVNVDVDDSLSLREYEPSQTERENFLEVLLFDKHLIRPAEELERFLAHYDKTGWVDKNGNKITNRLAALKAWDCKEAPGYSDKAMISRWHQIVNRFEQYADHSSFPDGRMSKISFLADFRGLQQENDKLIIYCSETLAETMERALNAKIVAALKELDIKKINYKKKE